MSASAMQGGHKETTGQKYNGLPCYTGRVTGWPAAIKNNSSIFRALSPPVHNIRAMTIVWRITGKIV